MLQNQVKCCKCCELHNILATSKSVLFLTAHEADVASKIFACAHVKANFTFLSSSLSPVCYKNTCLTIGLTVYHKYKIKNAPYLLNSQTRLPDYWLWPVSNFIKNVMILFFYCVILLSYLSSCCSVWPAHLASPCIVCSTLFCTSSKCWIPFLQCWEHSI